MRAYLIVVLHVRQQDVTKMPLAEHNNVVKALPVGSSRSAVQHIRFTMGSAATSVDHEYPLIEVFG
jgi:hypothetical protein